MAINEVQLQANTAGSMNARCLRQSGRVKRLRVRLTWERYCTTGGTWRQQQAPEPPPAATTFASGRVVHGQREHGAPLRSAFVALGAPPCITGAHSEMIVADLTPRKRIAKAAKGSASNIHDRVGA